MDYGVNLAWFTIKDIVVQYPGFSIGKITKAIDDDVRFNTNDQVHGYTFSSASKLAGTGGLEASSMLFSTPAMVR